MSAIDSFRAPAMAARPAGFMSKLAAFFSAWNDARVTRTALNRLTDRELDDIGLCRGDIDRVARGF